MNNLAASYSALGRHAEALKLREETLALMKAKLGPDHPDTLASMNNLATATPPSAGTPRPSSSRGDAGPEEGQARPRPPRHAREHANLAISYAALGRHAEALKLTRRRWP